METTTHAGQAPLADATSTPPTRSSVAWRRWAAKQIDLGISSMLALFLVALVAAIFPAGGVQHALAFAAVPVASLLFDALCISGFSTTPGKAIFQIYIYDSSGKRLSQQAAIRRAFGAVLYGQAFFIPLVNLVTQFLAFRSIRETGHTSWDEDVLVTAPSLTPLRKVMFALAVGILLVISMAIVMVSTSMRAQRMDVLVR